MPESIYQQQLDKMVIEVKSLNTAVRNISIKTLESAKLANKYKIPNTGFLDKIKPEFGELKRLQRVALLSGMTLRKIYNKMLVYHKAPATDKAAGEKILLLADKWKRVTAIYKADTAAFKAKAIELHMLINEREAALERSLKK